MISSLWSSVLRFFSESDRSSLKMQVLVHPDSTTSLKNDVLNLMDQIMSLKSLQGLKMATFIRRKSTKILNHLTHSVSQYTFLFKMRKFDVIILYFPLSGGYYQDYFSILEVINSTEVVKVANNFLLILYQSHKVIESGLCGFSSPYLYVQDFMRPSEAIILFLIIDIRFIFMPF